MSGPSKETSDLYEELKWITLREDNLTVTEKVKQKGLVGALTLLGFTATAGILLRGIHYMRKRDSQKQQQFMRYRVLAQGITVLITAMGIFTLKS